MITSRSLLVILTALSFTTSQSVFANDPLPQDLTNTPDLRDLITPQDLTSIKDQQDKFIEEKQQELQENKLIDKLVVEEKQQQQQMQSSVSFVLKGITITGNKVLTQKDVEGLIKPKINQQVTSGDLRLMADKITSVLKQKGFTTSAASVPAQQVKAGVVEIKVEEDRLAGIQITGENNYKYDEALFYQYFADLKGQVIHTPTLEQRLKYLTFLPSTRIKPVLKKVKFGQSVLVLQLTELTDTSFISIKNNAGTYQGDLRALYSTTVINPTGRSDRLDLYLTVNPEYPKYFSSVFAQYSLPYGSKGANLNFSYNTLSYQIDPEILGAAGNLLMYTGQSEQFRLDYEKPFLLQYGNNSWIAGVERRVFATQTKNLFAALYPIIDPNSNPLVPVAIGFEQREAGFKSLDQEETIFTLNIGAKFVLADTWFGESYPGQNRIEVKFAKAMEGAFGGLTQEDIDLKDINQSRFISPDVGPVGDSTKATANFWKFYLRFQRQQLLPWNLIAALKFNGEYAAFDNIPTSFNYGGADTGTSGYDWSLSLTRGFTLDKYLDFLNLELGIKQEVAFNYLFETNDNTPSVQTCGGLEDLVYNESYECKTSTPFASVRMKSGSHLVGLNYQSKLESFENYDKKLTVSYSYLF